MARPTSIAAAIALFLLAFTTAVLSAGDPDPLFDSNEVLEVTLVAPLTSIMRNRSNDTEAPGTLSFVDSDGVAVEFDVAIRARGHFRRRPDICEFAPLRLNFKKSQTKNTLFDHQDKLKMVTHCQSSSPRYDQFVIKEYLAYRVLNVISDHSFRARLLRVKYVDEDRGNSERSRLAMFIEHEDKLAKRLGTTVLKTRMVTFASLQPEHANLMSLFHYFIGNTDYSPISGSEGENCCHNHTLFDSAGDFILSVPYDFDMSGFVNAPHSGSNPRFKLRNVRQRLYRGRCVNNVHLAASLERFFSQRTTIVDMINTQKLMKTSVRKDLLSFVRKFFDSLDSPKKIDKKLVSDCS